MSQFNYLESSHPNFPPDGPPGVVWGGAPPPPPPLPPIVTPLIGTRWDMWKKRLEVYLTATGLEDDKQKQALLLFCAGESVHQLFANLPNAGDAKEESNI